MSELLNDKISPRAMNFSAGPSALPEAALLDARAELLDFADTGMSVMEQSHRGKAYEAVHDEALALVRELAGLSDDFEVLLLQGGASMQFAQIPMNFLSAGQRAEYVLTGVWGEKALAEAVIVAADRGAHAEVTATTAQTVEDGSKTYTRVPDPTSIVDHPGAAYLHFTSNETIHGVQFGGDPARGFPVRRSAPQVCDMSSDFLSRETDFSGLDLVYAGAQKNVGPSGVCIVLIRKELVDRGRKDIPTIFQYRTHVANRSLYNTPPTFGIYLLRNVARWMKGVGGVAQIEQWNRTKAETLYAAIDAHSGFYRCPVEPQSRSQMNVVFRLPSEALEKTFVTEAETHGMIGLEGHRSVGGIRVSLYNAVQVRWVETLTDFMKSFCSRKG